MKSDHSPQLFIAGWNTKVGDLTYAITLSGRFASFTCCGRTRESFGQGDMPLERLLRSEKWKAHITDIYGEEVLREVIAAARRGLAEAGRPVPSGGAC